MADVREVVETVVGGTEVTEVLDGPRRFPVVVRLPDELRANAEAVGAVLLTGRRGERVPLSRVARITETQAPEAINHENAERRLVVQTNVRGRDVGSFVARRSRAWRRELTLPPGYRIEWGGQFENQARATAAPGAGGAAVDRHHLPAALRHVRHACGRRRWCCSTCRSRSSAASRRCGSAASR